MARTRAPCHRSMAGYALRCRLECRHQAPVAQHDRRAAGRRAAGAGQACGSGVEPARPSVGGRGSKLYCVPRRRSSGPVYPYASGTSHLNNTAINCAPTHRAGACSRTRGLGISLTVAQLSLSMPAMFIIHHASRAQIIGLLSLFSNLTETPELNVPEWWREMYLTATH